MKKTVFLLLILFLCSNSFSGDKSWYKYFTGSIDTYPVTMSLVMYDNELRGFYYYDKYNKPIDIFGSVKGDSLELVAYTSYENSESFNGVLKNGNYTGKWSNSPDNKEMKFSLNEQKKRSGDFEFVYVKGDDRLFKDLETPSVSYIDGTIWPTDKYDNMLFVRNSILKIKNMKTGLSEIGDIMLANKKKFISGWKDDNSDLKHEEVADGGWSYSVDEVNIIAPVFYNDNLFVISSYNYSYTGGAHGNYGTGYYNLDLKHKKQLSLDDVFNKKDIKKLPALLEKYYKLDRGYPPEMSLQETGLFVDTIPLNDNFMISPGNLMFDYVPYEIASYADGEVTISIPYSEISDFVKPEVKELFK